MHEFDFINQYMNTQPGHRSDVILGIGDDCALIHPPDNQELAFSTDTLVENIHFLPSATANSLGHKCLAVSLSDLAAMGAEPAWVMLSITLPQLEPLWCEEFSHGFFQLLKQHQMQLIGGNTSRGPLTLTTQVCGTVPLGKALRRNGAQAGDDVYVTGFLGDAALALRCLQGELTIDDELFQLARTRLDYPIPRVATGIALRDIATAVIDVSDGLAADLQHILTQSQVGAALVIEHLPLSPALQSIAPEVAWSLALTGGDDYELCFTAPKHQRSRIEALFPQEMVCHRIGVIETHPGLRVRYANGTSFPFEGKGFTHF